MSESRDTCRRSFRTFLAKFGKKTNDNWILQIVKEGYKLEFIEKIPHTGIRKTNVSAKELKTLLIEVDQFLWKKRYRKCTCKKKTRRFLQYFFSSTPKDRGFETSDKSKTPKQFST